MNTAFIRQHHLNRWCVVLSQDSIYTVWVMRIQQKWKTCKCTSVIPHVWLRMRFLNATKRIASYSDWYKWKLDGWIQICTTLVIKFSIQPSDPSVQAGFPKKNRSEGERGLQKAWISHSDSHAAYMDSWLYIYAPRLLFVYTFLSPCWSFYLALVLNPLEVCYLLELSFIWTSRHLSS